VEQAEDTRITHQNPYRPKRSLCEFLTHHSSRAAVAKVWQNYRVRCGFIGVSSASDCSV